jgi:hypothetical protein
MTLGLNENFFFRKVSVPDEIDEWYRVVYDSGLLYSPANTSTNKNFDYPHVNFIVGIPFIKNQSPFRNTFAGIGLDIH